MGKFLTSIKKAFVEEVPTEDYEMPVNTTVYEEEEVVEAELEGVDINTLVDDIYTQNDLFDKTRSIFKVEELISSLPPEMVTNTKRTSVLAILGSFNLTATEVLEDGEKRISVLSEIKEQIDADCKNTIINKEAQIEEFKQAIATLNTEISNEQDKMKKSDEIIASEIAKLEALIRFIGGEN